MHLCGPFMPSKYYLGQIDEAISTLTQVLAEQPQMQFPKIFLGICYLSNGERERALALISPEVIKAAEVDGDISYWLAGFYALQHNVDEALRWFRRAIEMGNENYPWFYNDPSMNNLRDEPGFQQTMEALRINWEQLTGSRSPESPTGREPGAQASCLYDFGSLGKNMLTDITVYQKPTCSTCRNSMKILREEGVEFESINYYENAFTEETLKNVLRKLGMKPIEVIRKGEAIYKELEIGKKNYSDEELIKFMVAHPDLIQRPIVVKGDHARFMPSHETVKEIL